MWFSDGFWRAISCWLALIFSISFFNQVAAIEVHWIGGTTGDWSEPSNWSLGFVPFHPETNVTIDLDPLQDSTVELTEISTIPSLGFLNIAEGDGLHILNTRRIRAGGITLAGELLLDVGTGLEPSSFLWVQPQGSIFMNPGSLVRNFSSSEAPSIWNQGRIEGAGAVSGPSIFRNEGSIVSNLEGETLHLILSFVGGPPAIHVNTGEIVAENGGQLVLSGQLQNLLSNAEGGVDGLIEARGDSHILVGHSILGGVISTSSAGGTEEGMVTLNQAWLEDVRLEGNIFFESVTLQGVIENNSIPAQNQTPHQLAIGISGATTLAGNGRLELLNGSIRGIQSPFNSAAVLVNETNHTIAGPGRILTESFPMDVVNRGIIESDENLLLIELRDEGLSANSGTIRAFNGGTVELRGGNEDLVFKNSIDNIPGVIEADVNSEVILRAGIIEGGILRAIEPVLASGNSPGTITTHRIPGTTLKNVRLEGPIGNLYDHWNISGSIENTGTLSAERLQIQDEVTLTGGGEIQLDGDIQANQANYQSYKHLINEDNTIKGRGRIELSEFTLTNRGTILADELGSQLSIDYASQSPIVNSGELVASGGSELEVNSFITNYEGTTPGVIRAEDESTVRIQSVEGGILTTQGTGEVVVAQGGTMRNIHNQGLLRLQGYTAFYGTLQNEGTTNAQANVGNPVEFLGPVAHLSGNGIWTGTGPFAINVGSDNNSSTIMFHGADHTIQGYGTIRVVRGQFFNQGTIEASGPGILNIEMEPGTRFFQQGTLMVPSQRSMEIETYQQRFENEGVIEVDGHLQIFRRNQGPLEFINTPGSELHVDLQFGMATQRDPGSPILVWNQENALIAGRGGFNLIEDSSMHTALVRNSGVIRPEGGHSSTGHIFLNASFQQDDTGLLEFEVGGHPGSGWFDALNTNFDADLSGALDITLVDSFEPSVGHAYELVTSFGGTVTGRFDIFTAPALEGRWWSLDYLTDKVVLNVNAITADFNLDGYVDGSDLTEWQVAHQAGTDMADADGDGDSDGQDFLAWQRQFGSGIPLIGNNAVPEPATALLLVMGILLPLRKHHC
ncbi:hypothetical protein [Bythopirellula goksoeyrii]|uniref:Autotransporter-associated beta strand repeat protein n=1 Tax=Bythopirellula goksoeyrii TaxID=1400387 RepID=A0A5B9Q3R7_9BACT|nr:hypothetical protein [Bythopirellula goksoeyrii]QEG33654.1 hypothetical protein Pr1d_09180 [Bythopirellula goksoeyrii]